jgi:hypothetical protein
VLYGAPCSLLHVQAAMIKLMQQEEQRRQEEEQQGE